jgi:hypothetical protein
MPEEEGEDEPDADAHDPGNQHEHEQPHVGEGLNKAQCHISIEEGTLCSNPPGI